MPAERRPASPGTTLGTVSALEEKMTEAEWLGCDAPQKMLVFLQTRNLVNARKGRLFAVACCRRVWHLLGDRRSREAVEAAEGYADKCFDAQALERAGFEAEKAFGGKIHYVAADYAATAAIGAARGEQLEHVSETAAIAAGTDASPEGSVSFDWDEELWQTDILRCIFGNPFRSPPSLGASVLSWNDGCVVKLATTIYEERNFSSDRTGVLADALEEAGLADDEVLSHCRQEGAVHVRGCWVTDLLLGKE
jgi:hypothetical protein